MTRRASGSRALFELLFWPALVCLVLVSLFAAMRWYFALDMAAFSSRELHVRPLMVAVLFQMLIQVIVVLAWQWNLKLHGLREIRLSQALTMIGISAIGKYSPGKIWGLVARGAALLKVADDKRVLVLSTLVDQVALIHSGVVLVVLGYVYRAGHTLLLACLLVAAWISVAIVARSAFVFTRIRRWLGRQDEEFSDAGFRESYMVVFFSMAAVWLVSALVLHFCIAAGHGATEFSAADVLVMTVMSYLAGFLAFFSLAGLGVREGVMVGMLGLQIDLGTAVYISVMHRLLTLAVDLLLGLLAFLVSRTALATRNEQ